MRISSDYAHFLILMPYPTLFYVAFEHWTGRSYALRLSDHPDVLSLLLSGLPVEC